MNNRLTLTAATIAILCTCCDARAAEVRGTEVRIKDITDVEGIRPHTLTGMGLVTGLAGTGGKSPITRQFAQNFLQRFGIRADAQERLDIIQNARQKTDNLSVVTVTAELPAFSRRGSRIDVTVSAFDEASSLTGGTLVLTPLVGIDNQVYAMASGPVSVGGFSFGGEAATVQKNHPTTGRIPNGAIVEEDLPLVVGNGGCIQLLIRNADFETARRVAAALNDKFPSTSTPVDSGTVRIAIPQEFEQDPATFIGLVGMVRVIPDSPAKVIINERTGTVVMGENVTVSRVAITHANLAVTTAETPEVSQPQPFARQGETTVVPRTQLNVLEDDGVIHVIDSAVTVGDLARALNALGVTPRDLSAIFQELKRAGALHADLETL